MKKSVIKVFKEEYVELSKELIDFSQDLLKSNSELDYAEILSDISECRIKLHFLEHLASKLDILNHL